MDGPSHLVARVDYMTKVEFVDELILDEVSDGVDNDLHRLEGSV